MLEKKNKKLATKGEEEGEEENLRMRKEGDRNRNKG